MTTSSHWNIPSGKVSGMKKFAAAVISLALIPTMSSCSNDGSDEPSQDVSYETTSATPSRETEPSTGAKPESTPIKDVWTREPSPVTNSLMKENIGPFFNIDFPAGGTGVRAAELGLGENESHLFQTTCGMRLDEPRMISEGITTVTKDVFDRGEADPPVDAPDTKIYRESEVVVDMTWPGGDPVEHKMIVRSVLEADKENPSNARVEQVICM